MNIWKYILSESQESNDIPVTDICCVWRHRQYGQNVLQVLDKLE